ncbi:MAG: hypothetical protein J7L23_05395 [Candidatus Diapherotrites archaeon]|nr:hypothetical protein [Candidatus Diapherotrites archaeon]
MSDFGFEELRSLHRREKEENNISELGNNFYKRLALLIKNTKESYEGSPDANKLRQLENIKKLAEDLFTLREQKMVLKALRSIRTGKKEEHLTPEEEKVFNTMVDALMKNRSFFKSILGGVYPEEEIPKTILNKEEHKIVLIRIVKEVPRFVGADSKEYGPFGKNDMVKLPEAEANILVKRNLAEVV